MNSRAKQQLKPSTKRKSRLCLSCGDVLTGRRRRYCSDYCRQMLLAALNRRTGLLTALGTRYATFYFTRWMVIMDLLPYGTDQIYSFILPRGPGQKPRQAFCEMSNRLGDVWWAEKNRSHKRYLASKVVLDKAHKPRIPKEVVMPLTTSVPAVGSSVLLTLRLTPAQLSSDNLLDEIKRAYRRQAKRHHPDLGGKTEAFRRIHEAYEKLLNWAQHPTLIHRSGFPDKWFYEGMSNRWKAPIAQRRGF